MSWIGTGRNQYGSEVRISDDTDGRIEGSYRTALQDSGFYGQDVPLVGVARGNCISFASVETRSHGDMVVAYTGLLRVGRMETMWFYAGDDNGKTPWWKTMITNADTFERSEQ